MIKEVQHIPSGVAAQGEVGEPSAQHEERPAGEQQEPAVSYETGRGPPMLVDLLPLTPAAERPPAGRGKKMSLLQAKAAKAKEATRRKTGLAAAETEFAAGQDAAAVRQKQFEDAYFNKRVVGRAIDGVRDSNREIGADGRREHDRQTERYHRYRREREARLSRDLEEQRLERERALERRDDD